MLWPGKIERVKGSLEFFLSCFGANKKKPRFGWLCGLEDDEQAEAGDQEGRAHQRHLQEYLKGNHTRKDL